MLQVSFVVKAQQTQECILHENRVLSRVYGCVTNNNKFWIGWLDLLTASFTVTHNHNQSSAEDSLHPHSFSFYDYLQLNCADSYILLAQTTHRYCTCILNKIYTYFENTLSEHRNIHGLIVVTPACLAMFSRSAVLFVL
jgi:hypothetical protein